MRTFATDLLSLSLDHAECCEDLADALAAGVTGSLLMAYIEACATGIPVEYVLPCEVSVLSCAPLEARDATPASR